MAAASLAAHADQVVRIGNRTSRRATAACHRSNTALASTITVLDLIGLARRAVGPILYDGSADCCRDRLRSNHVRHRGVGTIRGASWQCLHETLTGWLRPKSRRCEMALMYPFASPCCAIHALPASGLEAPSGKDCPSAAVPRYIERQPRSHQQWRQAHP